MTFNFRSDFKVLKSMRFLSSVILVTLISFNVIASTNIDENSTSSVVIPISSVLEGISHTKDFILEQSNESNDEVQNTKDEKEGSDPIMGKEFIFTEALSQNSAMTNGGLPETGQPILITLVDTAAAELTNSVIEHLESDKLNNNTADTGRGYNASPVVANVTNVTENTKPVAVNESQNEHRAEVIVRAVPQEKEDNRAADKLKGTQLDGVEINNTIPLDNVLNVTAINEDVSDKEIVSTPAPSQTQEEIPSFAEWAQKQLEEAEKNKDSAVNHSNQSIKGTSSSNLNLKIRSKNYASPDCGAKIVATNPEAGSANYILTPNKDEYMLNTCNSRIWFIVELCEAIQAKKVDLANFELFSSTPKNISVFVSDRYPTREWASVGQFTAKDERDVQTFNLHPHLFGKFVKVELHSYYGSEHYCPISLFRVYGTSEFEVFETENSPQSQSNQQTEDDDDILEDLDITQKEDQSRNLFGSARDAVLSIVKKAAQVLVKSSSNNATKLIEIEAPTSNKCKTPSHIIVCDNCSNSVFADVFDLLSCHGDELSQFIKVPIVRDTLCNTDVCQNYGLDFKSKRTSYVTPKISTYITTFLFPSYIAALCNMLAIIEKKVVLNTSYDAEMNVTTNLTIDKKVISAVEDGNLNELLQKPFETCSDATDPQCSNINKPIKTDLKPPIKVDPEPVGGDISGIQPTRTIQRDTDSKQPVITVTESVPQTTASIENDHKGKEPSAVDIKASTEGVIQEVNTPGSVEKVANLVNDSMEQDNGRAQEKTSIPSPGAPQDTINNKSADSGENKNGSGEIVDESNLKISTQDQISLDNLLKELEQASSDGLQNQVSSNSLPSSQGQKESVFLRLSNRIKALERNMSLSGQYLEELSKRYKKQMEEMQKTFEKTLSAISEEAKKAEERNNRNAEEMSVLKSQLMELSVSVGILVSESDSWIGTLSLPKIIICQIILTFLIIYLFKKYTGRSCEPSLPERKNSKENINNKTLTEKARERRKSSEVPVSVAVSDVKIKKRRPSEEALHITRTATDMRENLLKAEKKKRKRKSPILHRSYSIATSPAPPPPNDANEWSPLDLSKTLLNTPVLLDEAEFLVPEMDPIDFHVSGDDRVPNSLVNTGAVKKEFPKTNGSIFGKITPDNKKTDKSRRLSSPAFFKAPIARSSIKDSPLLRRSVSPIVESNTVLPAQREVRSEERTFISGETDSPQLSTWSSIGDVSDTSGSIPTDTECIKKKRSKRSFKSIFKKVF